MLKQELLDILACPLCKGELEYDKEKDVLKCYKCMKMYPVKDDIPVMLEEYAATIKDEE